MVERLKRVWGQIGWFWFLSMGVLIVGVGLDTFLNPGPRFPSYPVDFTWAELLAVLLFGVAFLALVFRGWVLMFLVAASGLGLIMVPVMYSASADALLVSLWIGLAAYLLGDVVLDQAGLARSLPSLDQAAMALVTGIAGLMILSTALGFAGLYYPVSAWIVLGLPIVFLLPRKLWNVWRSRGGDWRSWFRKRMDMRLPAWCLAVILICGLGAYLWALAPAVRYDSLSYHIPVPVNNIRHHAIVEMPESLQSYWAHYAEALYTLGLLIEPSTALPGLLHYLMGLLATLFTYVLGRKLAGNAQGILAAVVFWSLPMVQVEAGSAYIDLFTAVFVAALVYAAVIWAERREDRWLGLCGVFAGMAVGIKLSTIFPVGLAALFILYQTVRQRRPFQIVLFVLPALAIAAPWFVREWIWTGNPVFPNYNQFFRSPKGFESTFFVFDLNSGGIADLYRLPIDLLFKSAIYYHEMPGYALGGLSLLALPWLYPWLSGRRVRLVLAIMAGAVTLGMVLSLHVSSNIRYLMWAYPLLAVLASENLVLLWRAFQSVWIRRLAFLAGFGLGTAYLFSTQLAVVVRHSEIPERYPYCYVLGLETSDDFLERTVPSYSAFRFLEENVQGPLKILSLGIESRLYTTAQIYGPYLSKEAYEVLHYSPNGDELAKFLSKLGYTHLMIYKPEVEYRPNVYTAPALDNRFLQHYTHLLYAQNQIRIYQLVFDPIYLDEASPNLLANPDFETLTPQGLPAVWELDGNPRVSSDGSRAHSGRVALQIAGPSLSGASQTVPVEAGQIYTLSYWASPESNGQVLQLYVQWLDGEQKVIAQSAEWTNLKPGWNNYQASFMSEAGTAYARFVVTTASPGETWVDDLCMTSAAACL